MLIRVPKESELTRCVVSALLPTPSHAFLEQISERHQAMGGHVWATTGPAVVPQASCPSGQGRPWKPRPDSFKN